MAAPASSRRAIWSWALYDFANSAFTTLVITFIYATYFTKGIAIDENTGTQQWSLAITLTAILVALLAPLLGAYADRTGTRKRFLFASTAIAIAGTALLFFPQQGQILFALSVVVIANVAFEITNVFYNAFLPEIAPPDKIGRVSGFGWALGYAGGLLCMVIALVVFVQPEIAPFGLAKETGANVRATNLLVAAWFALFSIPAFLFLKEPKPEAPVEKRGLIASTFGELRRTAREIGRYREIVRLLVARLFYNDGLVTVFAFGGIYAAGTFGFTFEQILVFGIVLNVAAGLGAFAFGFIDDKLGGRTTILISLVALSVATIIAVVGQTPMMLWIAGVLLGIAAGPNQAASRSLLGRFVPPDKETEFYGFFAFSGKLTAFMGPFLLGQLTAAFDSQRVGVSAVLLFFLVGGVLLTRVNESEGIRLSGRAEAANADRL